MSDEGSRDSALLATVFRHGAGDRGTSELSVLHIFSFDSSRIFMTSDWLMRLLSSDRLAALGIL